MALTARRSVVLPKLSVVQENHGTGGGGSSSSRRPLPALAGNSARRGSRSARAPGAGRQDAGPPSLPPARRGFEASSEPPDLRLSQYFDDSGKPRFRSFGLTFVAKQSPQFGRTFGSRSEVMAPEPVDESAQNRRSIQTFFLAAEARERDLQVVQQRTLELLNSINDTQRYQDEDVQRRQLEMLFNEVPDFRRFFPARVSHVDVLPVDLNATEEARNRREAEVSLGHLSDPFWTRGKEMKWALPRAGVLLLWQMASLWMQAAWGVGQHLGIDRSTFCRFLLDCGLVDQNKVPLFWAASLFDDLARPMRLGAMHSGVRHLMPVQPLLEWWDMISILDTILQQHFDTFTQSKFMRSLFPIANMRLPAFVIEESSLNQKLVDDILAGEAPVARFWSHTDEADVHQPKPVVRPDKVSASPQEIRRFETMRERLVQSLLVEPEVLHMILQHQEFFQKLHSCYSDEQGDMDFPMLLQFCVDFQLSPALVPASFVHRAFESSRCVTLRPLVPETPSPGACRRRTTARSPPQATGRRTRMGVKMAAPKEDRCCPSKPGTSCSMRSTSRPPSASSVSTSASTAATTATSATRATPLGTAPTPTVRASVGGEALQSDLPWRQVAKMAQQAASGDKLESGSRCPIVFGVGAFAEALCFIVFTYLGSYGNLQQRGMGGFARIVWLMTYLSHVITHLHRGLEKRAGLGDAPSPQSPLHAALQCFPLGEDPWVGRPLPSGMALSPTVFRLSLKPEGQPTPTLKRKRTKNGLTLPSVTRTASQPPQPLGAEDIAKGSRSATKRGSSERVGSKRLSSKGGGLAEWYLSKDSGGHAPPPSPPPPPVASKPEPVPPSSEETTKSRAVSKRTALMGCPCIVQGVCRVCGRGAPANDWGSARCYGCSVVDMLSFKEHPFKPLVLGWLGNLKPCRPVGHWPSKVPRSVLTPPSLGRSDELRRGSAAELHPESVPGPSCIA